MLSYKQSRKNLDALIVSSILLVQLEKKSRTTAYLSFVLHGVSQVDRQLSDVDEGVLIRHDGVDSEDLHE